MLYSIKAAGVSSVENRVDIKPVEAHLRSPCSVAEPIRHTPHQTRKEVIDYGNLLLNAHNKFAYLIPGALRIV